MMKQKLRLSVLLALALVLLAGTPAMALKILMEAAPGVLDSYVAENPEIETFVADDKDELIRNALSRSDEFDLYCLYTLVSPVYETLRDKGYFLPIEDAELLEMANSVYPEVLEAASCDGAVCAVPFGLMHQPDAGVDLDVWAELGLSEDALPKTWGQLLRFLLETWPELSKAHEDVSLFSDNDLDFFLATICSQYEAFRARNHNAFGYDTPEFREVMELFQRYATSQTENLYGEQEYTGKFLFTVDYYYTVWDLNESWRSLKLSFVEGDAGCCPVGIMVMAINPNSKHIDEAIEMCKALFKYTDPIDKMELCPNENEPIISENYLVQQEKYEAKRAEYQERIAKAADEAERKALEMEWAAYDAEMQQYFQEYKYTASPESIQKYREEVEGRMVPTYETGLSSEEWDILVDKRQRFAKGEISADQYITELERRYTFSKLEDK